MFWGLIMEPGRCYTQKVKVSFHVSMAALDISNSSDEPAQVMCVFEGRNYLLCTLHKKDKVQCALDLNFEAGSKVSFATNGKSHVHLTGYLITSEEDLFEEIEAEEEGADVSKKDKKRAVKELTDGPPNKKAKPASLLDAEEEDTSDSDFDLDHLIRQENEGEEDSEEEDDEEEDAEEEGNEDASSLSDEEESEEEMEEVKPKLNGVAKAKALPQQKKLKKLPEKVAKEKPKKQEEKKEQKQRKMVMKGGVIAQDIKEGTGEPVKEGKFVHVYYEGRFKDNNKMFDSTTKGPGFSFRLGRGEVIKGWDIGLVGMKVGGKRRIICPPRVAYGSDGSPPVIPPNATLVFEVDLKKIS